MATERIAVSPGVFTSEIDQSGLPQAIGEIGAVIIGPFVKGPAFTPVVVYNTRDAITKFGNQTPKYYTPYAVTQYLKNATKATIIRVLGENGYSTISPIAVSLTGSYGKKLISVLHPSFVVSSDDSVSAFETSTLTSNASGSGVLKISGSFTTDTSTFTNAVSKNGTAYSISLDPNDNNYINNVFGINPEGLEPCYNYVNFKTSASASLATDPSSRILIETGSLASPEWDFSVDYSEASTPWITSQDIGGTVQDLFKFHTLSQGDNSNYEIKIGISDIRPAGSIAGSQYGEFNVVVRAVDQRKIFGSPFNTEDLDTRPVIMEQFKCNLDPDSPNFISKVIGDKYTTIDSNNRVMVNGDYKNKSQYIRVELNSGVKNGATSHQLVPFGFKAIYSPIPSGFTQPEKAAFVTTQEANGRYNRNVFYGFDYDFANTDNVNYIKALPIEANRSTGSNIDFLLSNYTQHPSSSYPSSASPYSGSINLNDNQTAIKTRKFMVPFQGGFDGWKPNIQVKTGEHITNTNTQGFDISTTSGTGYLAYKKALDMVYNPEEYDLNLVVTPGVLHRLHSPITQYAIEFCEDRADAFYIMDGFGIDDNVQTAISTLDGLDTNYACTYYPWVKIRDFSNNKDVWVPPSVAVVEAYSYNDKVSAPWWAPAGLNRGRLTSCIGVKRSLNITDRNDLYESRINSIVHFTKEGIAAWGQKTLQGAPSALDRINVRRLMIAIKKFIASSSRYLVFDQNTVQLRNRFLNIVNPYLESVQQRQGLYAYTVIMDASNNTPETIDRNELIGTIYVKPTRTAEYILLSFNVMPTGATFPE